MSDQDPAERLAAALRRIAVGVERREANAAAAQSVPEHARVSAAEAGPDAREIATRLEALIARVRGAIDEPYGGS